LITANTRPAPYDLQEGVIAVENQESLIVIRALASGLDPDSNEPLQSESICRRPRVVRALNRALASLLEIEHRERDRPPNAGRSWTREEDAQVCAELRRGIDFQEIAKSHNRTVPSIVARLIKLGEIRPGAARSSATRHADFLNPETGLFPR
jgi:hypothetical protein